ncbi:MAG: CoA transferase, partial [Chloroflexota bacterium]
YPDLKVPALPMSMGDMKYEVRLQPPRLGEHTDEILASLGYTPAETDELKTRQVVRRSERLLNVDRDPSL